jgi:hypothetical protein
VQNDTQTAWRYHKPTSVSQTLGKWAKLLSSFPAGLETKNDLVGSKNAVFWYIFTPVTLLHSSPLHGCQTTTYWTKQRLININSTVTDEHDCAGTVARGSLPVRREARPDWELGRLSLVTLKVEAIYSSETTVLTRATRSHILEDGIHYSYCRENLKSLMK